MSGLVQDYDVEEAKMAYELTEDNERFEFDWSTYLDNLDGDYTSAQIERIKGEFEIDWCRENYPEEMAKFK